MFELITLSTREVAALFWLSLLILWAVRVRKVRTSLLQVAKRLFDGRIVFILAIFAAYIVAWVELARRLGVWDDSLIEETVFWYVLSGLPLLFKMDDAGRDATFFRRTALAVISVSVLTEFYFSIVSFSLPMELILVPVAGLITLGAIMVDTQKQYASQRRFWHGLLLLLLAMVSSATAGEIYAQREVLDLAQVGRSFALPIWLLLASLPFIFALALVTGYELAFLRMKFFNERRPVGWATRLALFVGLNWHLHELHAFAAYWPKQVASAPTFRLALEQVRAFREHRRQLAIEHQEAEARLARYAGVEATDPEGRRLDQREFAETKRVLRWISTAQMGWYRSLGGRYRPDLLEVLGDFTLQGLPEEHGVELKVSTDGQAWYAWRRTVSGWTFAIGAAKAPPDAWLYDGAKPPVGLPGTDPSWGTKPFDQPPNW
jgi:hypothetical protein